MYGMLNIIQQNMIKINTSQNNKNIQNKLILWQSVVVNFGFFFFNFTLNECSHNFVW